MVLSLLTLLFLGLLLGEFGFDLLFDHIHDDAVVLLGKGVLGDELAHDLLD